MVNLGMNFSLGMIQPRAYEIFSVLSSRNPDTLISFFEPLLLSVSLITSQYKDL